MKTSTMKKCTCNCQNKGTQHVLIGRWATTNHQNSFNTPWHGFYKCLKLLEGCDTILQETQEIPSLGVLLMVLETAVSGAALESTISFQLC